MAPGRLPRILYFSKNKIKRVEGFFFPGERRKRKPAATTTTSVIFSNKRPEIREGERRRMLTNLLALLLSTLPVWEHRVKGTPSTLGVSVTTSGYNNRIPQSLDSFGGKICYYPGHTAEAVIRFEVSVIASGSRIFWVRMFGKDSTRQLWAVSNVIWDTFLHGHFTMF